MPVNVHMVEGRGMATIGGPRDNMTAPHAAQHPCCRLQLAEEGVVANPHWSAYSPGPHAARYTDVHTCKVMLRLLSLTCLEQSTSALAA